MSPSLPERRPPGSHARGRASTWSWRQRGAGVRTRRLRESLVGSELGGKDVLGIGEAIAVGHELGVLYRHQPVPECQALDGQRSAVRNRYGGLAGELAFDLDRAALGGVRGGGGDRCPVIQRSNERSVTGPPEKEAYCAVFVNPRRETASGYRSPSGAGRQDNGDPLLAEGGQFGCQRTVGKRRSFPLSARHDVIFRTRSFHV